MSESTSLDCPPVRYRIDRHDRLVETNAGWADFSATNGGPGSQSALIGRPIWDFISDATTIHIYQTLVRRARQRDIPARLRFRCDAPDRRRLLTMAISPAADGDVLFAIDSLREQSRPAVRLLDVAQPRSDTFLTMCGWCARARVTEGQWLEVEHVIAVLGLFTGGSLPQITHGICPGCSDRITTSLDDPAAAAEVMTSAQF